MKPESSLTNQIIRLVTLRRDFMLTLGLLAVGALLVLFVILPQISGILDLSQKVAAAQKIKTNLERKAILLEEINTTPLFAQQESIDAALPSNKPLAELLTILSSEAQSAAVSVTKVNLTPGLISTSSAKIKPSETDTTSPVEGVQPLKIEITILGTFAQVDSFLNRLDAVAPVVLVTNLRLSEQGKDASQLNSSASNFSATLTLDTYYFTRAVASAVEQELPDVSAQDQNLLAEIASFTRSSFVLPTQIIGGGIGDVFGLTQADIENALVQQDVVATTSATKTLGQ